MQELDRFDGVVIVFANLFVNYAPALLGHIHRHIKYRNPDDLEKALLLAGFVEWRVVLIMEKGSHAMMECTTSPATSVRRKSRPA